MYFGALTLPTIPLLRLCIFQNETSKATRDAAERVYKMAVEFLPALVITLINVVFPFVFDILVRLEVYKLEREVQVG